MVVLLVLSNSCKKKEDNSSNNQAPNNGIIFNPNLTYGTMKDIDGNVYKTIVIGTQTWMAENLKTTRLSDGTPISLVTDSTAYFNLTTSGYCWYYNDAATYKNSLGALYNWYAVNTGKLAPAGWHVPTETEWKTLITYLGGDSIAGGKMKETGTIHWSPTNTGATNECGFTGIPAGERGYGGEFGFIGHEGSWWSSTPWNNSASYRLLSYDNTRVYRDFHDYPTIGISIRCIKD